MRLLAQRFDKKWEFLRGVQVRQSQQRFFFRVADFDSSGRGGSSGGATSGTNLDGATAAQFQTEFSAT